MLIAGNRYEWRINNYDFSTASGLFSGTYDENGLAVFISKNGDEWHVKEDAVWEIKNKNKAIIKIEIYLKAGNLSGFFNT